MEMAKFGATPKGGISRQTLTDLDKAGARPVQGAVRGAGLHGHCRLVGNMFARRPGRTTTVADRHGLASRHPAHRRQVRRRAGVLGALEALRTLVEAGYETNAPIEVVNWTNEEGSRFAPAMLASGV